MSEQVLIDHGRLLDALRIEVDLVIDAGQHAQYDTRIPACPGLTVGETMRHLGSVYRMVESWLLDGKRPGEWQREPAPGEPVASYLRNGFDALVGEFESRDPHAPAGTWWPRDQTVGFWRRRMVHETTIHRTDVQGAAALVVTEVDADVALDGIDEVLLLWFGHRLGVLGVSGTREGSVAVCAGEQVWFARAGPSYAEARRGDESDVAVADARVSGSPMQVYRWLWGRIATNQVTTDGDDDAVAQLWALLRLATR
ncbi:MAG: maleylpyruvate isomerase family mycothiol-dependent enzyme [Actinophytocola sp.]|nr:maleylpyruvate isomerase family mycothiol-dependent enzyme [Actinophytocola sp.]